MLLTSMRSVSFLLPIMGAAGADVDIIRLLTGMTMLTIEEVNGKPNESFIYHIIGTYGKEDKENWTLYPEDLRKASTSIWHSSNMPIEEHKTVICEHKQNDKVWLSGENHADNRFEN